MPTTHRTSSPLNLLRSNLARTSALVFLGAAALACAPPLARAQATGHPEIIGYVFPNLPGDRALTAADVRADQLTRINYAFALIKDGRVVEGAPNDAANLGVLTGLRASHPGLKILISVGGWLGSGGFSDAALTPDSRKLFIDSALDFVKRYDLDGLDIDWEYPGLAGAGNHFRPEDGANFNRLLKDLRARFDAQAQTTRKPLLLTIAAGASMLYLKHTQLGEGQRYLDTVNLMTYDFYESGDGKPTPTGNHAPLFADPADPQKASSAAMVQAFEQAGVPAAKIVLGVPFYGHTWGNVPPANHGLFQTGVAVPNLHAEYPDVQAMLHNGFTRYWDNDAQVPYAYNATTRQFVSYEDPESLERKCAYVRDQHLGGVMFWQYLSDPTGTLLNAIYTGLNEPKQPSEARP